MEGEKRDWEQRKDWNHQWHCGKGHRAAQRETNDREGPDREKHSCQGFPVRTYSKARVEKVKQQWQFSEVENKEGSVSQTKALRSKASATLPKAVFSFREVSAVSASKDCYEKAC